MRFFAVYITLFVAICCSTTNTLTPTSSISNIEKSCLDTLILQKRDYIFDEKYDVELKKNTPLTIIIKIIKDSITSDEFTNTEKEKLINALTDVTLTETKNLIKVKSSTDCGQFFIDDVGSPLMEMNPLFNFYKPKGFKETTEGDREFAILQKYKDSSKVVFDSEPSSYDKGSYFKLNDKKNKYVFNNYETHSNDGGNFWTMYKISNILEYTSKGWLKSAVQYRFFFKHYSTEEKILFDRKENDSLDFIWHYTFFETQLDPTNSFISSIVVYYIVLDNTDQSEESSLSIKKHTLTLKYKE